MAPGDGADTGRLAVAPQADGEEHHGAHALCVAGDRAGNRTGCGGRAGRQYVPAIMNLVQSNEFEQAVVDAR